MDDGGDKDWRSINEAARCFKVTPMAIRNRIKRGKPKTKPNGNHGRLVHVPLPVPPTVVLPVALTGSDTVPPPWQTRLPSRLPPPLIRWCLNYGHKSARWRCG